MKRYFRNYTTIYEPENTYFIEDLKTESDYVIQELKRLEKEKQKLEKYLSEISNRASEVLQLEYYYFIEVRREKNFNNKVNYFAVVKKCVVGDDGKAWNNRKVKTIKSFKFSGKERNLALKKADELLKEYNTKDLRKNF